MATVQVNPPSRVKVTVLTATGSFVPDARAVQTLVQLQAAGGTSSGYNGGAAAVGSSGGNGGNYMEVLFTVPLGVASVTVTLGAPTAIATTQVAHSAASSFGSYFTVTGGMRGNIYSTGGTEAQIGAPNTQAASPATAFGALSATVLLDIPGGSGGGISIPRATDYGFIKGGDGGRSVWGTGGNSEAAIYSGSRGYVAVVRSGYGYGFGGAGAAYGSVTSFSGQLGGPARCVITEYF